MEMEVASNPMAKGTKSKQLTGINEQVKKAKDFIIRYVNSTTAEKHAMGGSEAVSVNFSIARIRKTSGDVTIEDIEQFSSHADKLLDSVFNFLLNEGVIAALLLSIFYGFAITPVEASNSSTDFFGEDFCDFLIYVVFILMALSVFLSLGICYTTARVYSMLSFKLQTYQSRIQLLMKIPFYELAVANILLMCLCAYSVPIAAAVAYRPSAGIVGLLLVVGMHWWMSRVESYVGGTAHLLLEAEVKEFLGAYVNNSGD